MMTLRISGEDYELAIDPKGRKVLQLYIPLPAAICLEQAIRDHRTALPPDTPPGEWTLVIDLMPVLKGGD